MNKLKLHGNRWRHWTSLWAWAKLRGSEGKTSEWQSRCFGLHTFVSERKRLMNHDFLRFKYAYCFKQLFLEDVWQLHSPSARSLHLGSSCHSSGWGLCRRTLHAWWTGLGDQIWHVRYNMHGQTTAWGHMPEMKPTSAGYSHSVLKTAVFPPWFQCLQSHSKKELNVVGRQRECFLSGLCFASVSVHIKSTLYFLLWGGSPICCSGPRQLMLPSHLCGSWVTCHWAPGPHSGTLAGRWDAAGSWWRLKAGTEEAWRSSENKGGGKEVIQTYLDQVKFGPRRRRRKKLTLLLIADSNGWVLLQQRS